MIAILIVFSQLYISGGGHIKSTSFLYLEPTYAYGIGVNFLFREEGSNLMPEISVSYLWNQEEKLEGLEFEGTLWKLWKKKLKSGFYPGIGMELMSYRTAEYHHFENYTLLSLSLSGLINIKIQKFGMGLKGTVQFPFYFIFLIYPYKFEFALEFYRLPE